MPRTDLRGGAEAIVIPTLSALSAIVFDFDGTIVESVNTKTEAFRTLFSNYPAHVEQIVALHLQHGGRSRYEKFAMIYRDVLRQEPQPGEFATLGRRFEALVYDAVVAAPFVKGARRFLDTYAAELPLVLVSGTPHDELARIIDDRGLRSRFLEVVGSPPEKEDILGKLMNQHDWSSDRMVFVGDAMSDYAAASALAIPFVGRVPPGERSVFPDTVLTVPDLTELDAVIRAS